MDPEVFGADKKRRRRIRRAVRRLPPVRVVPMPMPGGLLNLLRAGMGQPQGAMYGPQMAMYGPQGVPGAMYGPKPQLLAPPAPPAGPSGPPAPTPGPDDPDEMGALMRGQIARCRPGLAFPGPRRNLQLRQTSDGEVVAVDELGQVFGVDLPDEVGGSFGEEDEFFAEEFGAEDYELGAETDDLLAADDEEILGATASSSPYRSLGALQRNMALHYERAARRGRGWKKHLKKARALKEKVARVTARVRQLGAQSARAQDFIARHHPLSRNEWKLARQQARGGLEFAVDQAPPGSGRLLRIPMYAAGQNVPGLTGTPAADFGSVVWTTLTTKSLPYAKLQVVGFQTSLPAGAKNIGTTALVRNLQTAGGASLFLVGSSDALNAEAFDVNEQALAGLRTYPVISETNVVSVDAALLNVAGVGVATHFDCWLVCEVLDDDLIGRGDRGVYAA